MKKIVIFLSFVFMLTASVHAADEALLQTHGYKNGNYWKALDEVRKTEYLIGFNNGILMCSRIEMNFDDIGVDRDAVKKIYKSLDMLVIPWEELDSAQKRIDAFYTEPLNLHIPVHQAYLSIVWKGRGYITDIEKHIKGLRKFYSKPQPPDEVDKKEAAASRSKAGS